MHLEQTRKYLQLQLRFQLQDTNNNNNNYHPSPKMTSKSSISRLSTRISLRWLPEPPFENTDTLVLSVRDWYVDFRAKRADSGEAASTTGTEIDWAIAGRRIVESLEPVRVLFTHDLDSRNSFESVDCGTFTKLSNGDDLERGSMPRPDLPGTPITEYEEVWRELSFPVGPERNGRGVSWILESEFPVEAEQIKSQSSEQQRITKTFLGRIWGVYVALRQEQTYIRSKDQNETWVIRDKKGGNVSARREEWSTSSSSWKEKYVCGSEGGSLPSLVDGLGDGLKANGQLRTPGEKVVIKGDTYIVRASEEVPIVKN